MKKYWKPYKWLGSMSGNEAYSVVLRGEEETQKLAAYIAAHSHTGDCVALKGDLGSGKTVFCRGFIRALCGKDMEITSPTFTLAQTYTILSKQTIWHFDLYRLRSSADLREIGLDEALMHGISLIEWPELAQSYLPSGTVEVTLQSGADTNGRIAVFSRLSDRWKQVITSYQPIKVE